MLFLNENNDSYLFKYSLISWRSPTESVRDLSQPDGVFGLQKRLKLIKEFRKIWG
ncbi:hypothetical protein OkiPb00406_08130 [Escherichia coli]|nr:hypothetical protein CL8F690_35230 [Escherichia coli]GHJ62229.1 hypothetical protein SE18013_07900 [Escherichia coli O157:H7]BDM92864.1 hypothetical protein CL8F765_35400 [Escherichia coli]BDM98133.1 hypothetical protein CL8FH52_34760 [Escherichia coli]BDN03518.1 hypothetical protein CL8NIID8_35940 [Escherichia coli]